ncbi:hypothetical protein PLICRDRAFT_52347 [Plicaturopsis crispa FD-325 SS-3]|nr:hypothetical protein PLICRDRAFT_52347 [Plicaturopsis crispa FD-325 SS-3]
MPFEPVLLNDGYKLPTIAFGTGSALYERDASELVGQAIDVGFDHIDTAQIYKNEDSVGTAIKNSGLARSDLYVTTKYGGGDIQTEVRTSLLKLGLSFVDLYLIHNPKFVENDPEGAWKELEKIKADGLSKSIGVSNFNLEQLQTLIKTANIKPAVNQIRFHPYNYAEHKSLLEYSAKHGIVTEAYSSLTPITKTPGGPVDEPINVAAKRIGATPTQVILSWVRSKGVVIVTTSRSKEHLKEYLAVPDLPPLTADEIAAIDEAGAKGPPFALSGRRGTSIGGAVLALLLTTLVWVFWKKSGADH